MKKTVYRNIAKQQHGGTSTKGKMNISLLNVRRRGASYLTSCRPPRVLSHLKYDKTKSVCEMISCDHCANIEKFYNCGVCGRTRDLINYCYGCIDYLKHAIKSLKIHRSKDLKERIITSFLKCAQQANNPTFDAQQLNDIIIQVFSASHTIEKTMALEEKIYTNETGIK